jgi:hypothetical protein
MFWQLLFGYLKKNSSYLENRKNDKFVLVYIKYNKNHLMLIGSKRIYYHGDIDNTFIHES